MVRPRVIVALLILGVLSSFSLPVLAQEGRRYRTDRVILLPKRDGKERLANLHHHRGRRVLKRFPTLNDMQVVELAPGENVAEVLERYRASGEVEFAEPDYKLSAFAAPNDPEFRRGTQWALYNSGQAGGTVGSDIHAKAAWDTLTSASNIVVAVIDSGVRYSHEDLKGNMWVNPGEIPGNGVDDDRNGYIDDVHGIDAIMNSGNPMDEAGHGTHVAGILGAVGNNGTGITGVAWDVKIMACRFLNRVGDGDTSDAIQCIDYARRMGAQVINASWGGPDYSAALYSAISNARAAGIIVVAAAGNDSENIDVLPLYPACFNLNNIVVVGGTTRNDLMDVTYSSWGANNVDLFAPGTGIYSTWHTWDGAYTSNSGTSMAAPHVSGTIALMRARFPSYTFSQLIERLYATVDVLPDLNGRCRTSGRLNMARALGPNPAAGFSASKVTGEPPLTVSFTNLSFGSITSHTWDFGDGSATETNVHPTHVFEYPGTFRVELEVVGSNGVTNSYSRTISVTPNYDINTNEVFVWIDPADMPVFTLQDNGVTAEQPLPFPFRLFGESFSTIYIGANGVLGFETNGLATADNTGLPNPAAPNGLICPYWDNLVPSAGGSIHAGVIGEPPNRRYVVSWVDVPRSSSAANLTFQAILEEETQDIVFQYLEVHPTPTSLRGGGRRATIGLENSDGTAAVLFTYNGAPVVVQNQTAVRFAQKPFRYLLTTPSTALAFSGVKGYEFAENSRAVTLENSGNRAIDWTVGAQDDWLEVTQSSGTLLPQQTAEITISLALGAMEFEAGVYRSAILITNVNDGRGNRAIPVELVVAAPELSFFAELVTTNLFLGGLGGPFAPETLTAMVRNTGNVPVEWTGQVDTSWLELSPPFGVLVPGQSETVEVRLTGSVEELLSGRHIGVLSFDVPELPGVDIPVFLQVNTRIEPQSATILNGRFRGNFAAPAEGVYTIEISVDLENWWPLNVIPKANAGNVSFEDPEPLFGMRFYRLVVTQP